MSRNTARDGAIESGDGADGSEAPKAPSKPHIVLKGGDLDLTVEQSAVAMKGQLYLRGSQLVRISMPLKGVSKCTQLPGQTELRSVDSDWLRVELTRQASFKRPDHRCPDGLKDVDPPANLASAVIAAADTAGFRPLRGVVSAPLVRPDGSLATAPGYDPETALFFDIPPEIFRGVTLRPSRAEAEHAARDLNAHVSSFPFAENADRAVALSAILTILQRPVLPTSMMHVFDSPTPGTGKTKLTALASAIGTGRRASVMSISSNDEETNKRLDAMILAGNQVLVLDNIETALGGDKLCSMLSEPSIAIRPLGASSIVRVPLTTTVMATGNNLRLKGDVTRRALIARLDAKVERPELREFGIDPVAEALKNRWDLVRAALAIILAYHVAGCPKVARPIGSFEEWCRMVRDPLIWAGCADPADTMERLREDDPALGDLQALQESWVSHFSDKPQLVAEVVRSATLQDNDLTDALEAVAGSRGTINKRRLGHYLRRHVDRVVCGRKIVDAGKRQGSTLWRIVKAA